MANGFIGSPSGNRIVPITNFTKSTKEVTLTVTSAQAGWSTIRAISSLLETMWINNVRYAWEYPKPSIYVYVPITMSDSTEFNEDTI